MEEYKRQAQMRVVLIWWDKYGGGEVFGNYNGGRVRVSDWGSDITAIYAFFSPSDYYYVWNVCN